jgi:hypothetical protein
VDFFQKIQDGGQDFFNSSAITFFSQNWLIGNAKRCKKKMEKLLETIRVKLKKSDF